jgi:hypothetical protein
MGTACGNNADFRNLASREVPPFKGFSRVQSNDRTGGTAPLHFSTTNRTPALTQSVVVAGRSEDACSAFGTGS